MTRSAWIGVENEERSEKRHDDAKHDQEQDFARQTVIGVAELVQVATVVSLGHFSSCSAWIFLSHDSKKRRMAHFTNNGVLSGEPLFTKTMNPLLRVGPS